MSTTAKSPTTWLVTGALLLGGALLVAALVLVANHTNDTISSQQNSMTTAALQADAIIFNEDYHANIDGPVWSYWDPQSQAIISKQDFVTRHAHCNTAPGRALIGAVTPAGNGYYAVAVTIDGVALRDYWHLVGTTWRFSLAKSNPTSVALYQKSPASYYAALGCRA